MTNIKYLKENNLLSAHEHFMKLSESYVPNFPEEEVDEADDQGAQDPNSMGSDPSQDPSAMGTDPNAMGNDMIQDPSMGADPSAMGSDISQDPNEMGGDPSMGADPSAMGGDESEGQDDGDTIDIDGLTRAQDKLNVKQNHVGRDLSKVDTKINAFKVLMF